MDTQEFKNIALAHIDALSQHIHDNAQRGWTGISAVKDAIRLLSNKLDDMANTDPYADIVYTFQVSDQLVANAILAQPENTEIDVSEILPGYVLSIFEKLLTGQTPPAELVRDCLDHTWKTNAKVNLSIRQIANLITDTTTIYDSGIVFSPTNDNPVIMHVPFVAVADDDDGVSYVGKVQHNGVILPKFSIDGYIDPLLDTGDINELRDGRDGENFAYMLLGSMYSKVSGGLGQVGHTCFESIRKCLENNYNDEPNADNTLAYFPLTLNDVWDYIRIETCRAFESSMSFRPTHQVRALLIYMGYFGVYVDVDQTLKDCRSVSPGWFV